WKDRTYRSARRAGQAIAALIPVAERAPLIVPPQFLPDDELDTGTAVGASPRGGRYPWDDDLEH
ncbi:MAG: hypothetical protein ACRDOU_33825, partial [Streptosporangiaceae bacterium]